MIQPARQGVAGAVQQKGGGEKILIPHGDEHHHTGDHDGRFGQREHNAQDHLPVTGAVDAGGLLDLHRDSVEISLHVPQGEHTHGARVDQDESSVGVQQADGLKHPEEGEHRQDLREGIEHQQQLQCKPPAGKPPAGKGVGRRHRAEHRKEYGAHAQNHRVAEPQKEWLVKQDRPIVFQSGLGGPEGKP